MNKEIKIVKVPNEVSDIELVKIITEYEEEGYSVVINSEAYKHGFVELVLKKLLIKTCYCKSFFLF